MSTLERAIALAAQAHEGQVDKSGQPYILHPIRVMLHVPTLDQKIAAILHDVVEDTSVTLDDLRREGFAEHILAAVDALTKRPGESRMDAAKRAGSDKIALMVKLSDLRDNMDPSRI